MPVSRVGTGFAAAPEPGVVPVSRVAVAEFAFAGEPVSCVALVALVGAVGRSVSRPAPELVTAVCVVGLASGPLGAVTVASLTGSGCAVGVFTGLLAGAVGFGTEGFTDGLSVGSGAPGPILIARRLGLMVFGAGSVARACGTRGFGARISFVTLG